MVFGWGRKKAPEPIPTKKEIPISAVLQALAELEELRSRTAMAEARSFRTRTVPKLGQLLSIARALERDDVRSEEIDRRLKGMVLRGKRQVIATIKAEAGRPVVEVDSMEDVRTLADGVGQSIKRIGDALGRHTRVIHIFAKKHTGQLKGILSTLNSERDEFFKAVKRFEEFEDNASAIRALMKQAADTEATVALRESKVSQLLRSIELFTKDEVEANDSVKAITSSQEYQRHRQAVEELEAVRREEEMIKREIEGQFTKISRPLSKYVRVASLDKSMMSLLEMLISDPAAAICSRPKSETVYVLMAVRRGVLSGTVSVKDQRKSASQIDNTVEVLDRFRAMLSDHAERCHKQEARLKNFDASKLDACRERITKVRKGREDCEGRVQVVKAEIRDLVEQRKSALSKVEELLNAASSARYVLQDTWVAPVT